MKHYLLLAYIHFYSHNRPEYNWRIGSWDNGATNKDHSKVTRGPTILLGLSKFGIFSQ